MARHHQTGKKGEELAEEFLKQKGHHILYKNWRYSHYEIDLITDKDGMLHIIEVKARTTATQEHPEESVTKKKFRFLLLAADEFLYQHPQYRHVQFDILAITLHKNRDPDIFLIEDVYL